MLGAFSRSRGAWLCAASLAGASSWACRVSLREASCEAHASGIAPPLATPASSRPSRLRKRPGPAASEQSPGPLPAAATVHKLPLPCFRVRSTFPFAKRKPKLGHLHPVPRKSEEGRPRGPGAGGVSPARGLHAVPRVTGRWMGPVSLN